MTFDLTEGGSHTKVRLGDSFVTVPRHNEINELTANGIRRDAREIDHLPTSTSHTLARVGASIRWCRAICGRCVSPL